MTLAPDVSSKHLSTNGYLETENQSQENFTTDENSPIKGLDLDLTVLLNRSADKNILEEYFSFINRPSRFPTAGVDTLLTTNALIDLSKNETNKINQTSISAASPDLTGKTTVVEDLQSRNKTIPVHFSFSEGNSRNDLNLNEMNKTNATTFFETSPDLTSKSTVFEDLQSQNKTIPDQFSFTDDKLSPTEDNSKLSTTGADKPLTNDLNMNEMNKTNASTFFETSPDLTGKTTVVEDSQSQNKTIPVHFSFSDEKLSPTEDNSRLSTTGADKPLTNDFNLNEMNQTNQTTFFKATSDVTGKTTVVEDSQSRNRIPVQFSFSDEKLSPPEDNSKLSTTRAETPLTNDLNMNEMNKTNPTTFFEASPDLTSKTTVVEDFPSSNKTSPNTFSFSDESLSPPEENSKFSTIGINVPLTKNSSIDLHNSETNNTDNLSAFSEASTDLIVQTIMAKDLPNLNKTSPTPLSLSNEKLSLSENDSSLSPTGTNIPITINASIDLNMNETNNVNLTAFSEVSPDLTNRTNVVKEFPSLNKTNPTSLSLFNEELGSPEDDNKFSIIGADTPLNMDASIDSNKNESSKINQTPFSAAYPVLTGKTIEVGESSSLNKTSPPNPSLPTENVIPAEDNQKVLTAVGDTPLPINDSSNLMNNETGIAGLLNQIILPEMSPVLTGKTIEVGESMSLDQTSPSNPSLSTENVSPPEDNQKLLTAVGDTPLLINDSGNLMKNETDIAGLLNKTILPEMFPVLTGKTIVVGESLSLNKTSPSNPSLSTENGSPSEDNQKVPTAVGNTHLLINDSGNLMKNETGIAVILNQTVLPEMATDLTSNATTLFEGFVPSLNRTMAATSLMTNALNEWNRNETSQTVQQNSTILPNASTYLNDKSTLYVEVQSLNLTTEFSNENLTITKEDHKFPASVADMPLTINATSDLNKSETKQRENQTLTILPEASTDFANKTTLNVVPPSFNNENLTKTKENHTFQTLGAPLTMNATSDLNKNETNRRAEQNPTILPEASTDLKSKATLLAKLPYFNSTASFSIDNLSQPLG